MGTRLHVDEKLARGLTMAEVRAVLRAGRGAVSGSVKDPWHPVRVAFKPVAFRYETGRRPDARYVDELLDRFDAHYGSAAGTVHREVVEGEVQEGLRARGRRFLVMVPSTDDPYCRSLLVSCVSLDVRARCLTLIQVPLFEIEMHAVERFHLRTRGGLVREALGAFGGAILRDVGLYKAMAEFSDGLPNKAFAMPFADGLLMGHACPVHPAAMPPYLDTNFFDDRPRRLDKLMLGGDESCRVATFYGPLELDPGQRLLRDGLVEIAGRNAAYLRDHADGLTAPALLMDRIGSARSDFDRFERGKRELRRQLQSLMAMPGMDKALGGGRTGTVTRPPPRS